MLFVAEEVSHTVPSMSWSHLGLEGPGKGNGNSWNICYIPERLFSQEHLPTSLRWSGGYHQLGRPLWRALKGLSPFKTKQNKKNPKIKHGPLSTGRGRNSTILGDFLGKNQNTVLCFCYLDNSVLCGSWQYGSMESPWTCDRCNQIWIPLLVLIFCVSLGIFFILLFN